MDGGESVRLGDVDDGGGAWVNKDVDEDHGGKSAVVDYARVSSIEASGGGDVGDLSGDVGLVRSEGLGSGDVGGKVVARVSEVKEEILGRDNDRLDDVLSGYHEEGDRFHDNKDAGESRRSGDGELDKRKVSERKDDASESSGKTSSAAQAYTSFMSEFDEYVINEKNNLAESSAQNALRYGYKVGDMVWGKVKSHPWWPGHIFNEAFATSSVRKSRRNGSVLVAFFGDSSSGWFDPSELIHFEPNFTEKSMHITSRVFIKAVEEAVDETCRRRGLGLTCKCRNAYNFRPTSVRGYFAVDVPDYEPGSVYSFNQITKSRESFKPLEALSFLKQLALAPKHCDSGSLDAIQNKSTVFAYRKAIFEEFDETYAQAFGVQAAHLSSNPADVPLSKEPSIAPLSGPLVFAEALGGARTSAKPVKAKDHSKKEKYLLKRRDDTNGHQIIQTPGPALSSAAYKEELSASAAGGYILQKRAASSYVSTETPDNIEQTRSATGATLIQEYAGQNAVAQQPQASRTSTTGHMSANAQSSGDFAEPPPKPGETAEKTDVLSPSYDPDFMRKGVVRVSAHDVTMHDYGESVVPSEINFREGGHGQNQFPDGVGSAYLSLDDAKHTKFKADGAAKRTKKILGPGPENIGVKKKLKRKEMDSRDVCGRPKKHLMTGKAGASVPNLAGKMSQIESAKKVGGKSASSASSRLLPVTGYGKDLRKLFTSLQALAIDHNAVDKSSRAATKQAFLGFRNLVYEKSLVLAPPTETDSSLVQPAKAQAEVGALDPPSAGLIKARVLSQPYTGVIKKPQSIKPVKPTVRPDVPVKGGQKRPPSDRREEIEAKRMKRTNDLKSLSAEKRTAQKVPDTPSREVKEVAPAVSSKSAKSLTTKKIEPPRTRVSAPTMLVMKFPQEFSLPSVPELKARFARFGPLDSSGIRVFWKSSTCRVVFQHKSDAEAAHNYAVGNSSLFGNASVRYHIRDAGAPASETPEDGKSRGDDDSVNETVRTIVPLSTPTHYRHVTQQSPLQLKSCLKKPPGDVAGLDSGNGSRGARVKFILGGEENNRQEKITVCSSDSNVNGSASTSYGEGVPSSSSSFGTVINSKVFQKLFPVESSSSSYQLPPLLPRNLPPQGYSVGTSSSAMQQQLNGVDISQQMISLLTRCNDVVNNLSGLLGYVPYHPL